MYKLQEVKEMKKEIQINASYLRFQKDRQWRNFQACKSILENLLSKLSTLKEEEITKKQLLELISANCDYMRALNLYNYYKDLLAQELAQKHLEGSDNE